MPVSKKSRFIRLIVCAVLLLQSYQIGAEHHGGLCTKIFLIVLAFFRYLCYNPLEKFFPTLEGA